MKLKNIIDRLKQSAKPMYSFVEDSEGNVSVILAVSMVPVLMIAGMAVDYARANRSDFRLQASADAAALAAAAMIGSDEADRTTAANSYFSENYDSRGEGTATITNIAYGQNTVTVEVQAVMPKGLTAIVHPGDLTVTATSVAFVEEGGPICMLALSETASQAIYLHGNPEILATGCQIQARKFRPHPSLHWCLA